MAEALKHIFSRPLIETFAQDLQQVWPAFQENKFVKAVLDEPWEALELKQRIRQISLVLRNFLPEAYPAALDIVVQVSQINIDRQQGELSFEYIFLPDFVEIHGLQHFDASIAALETITCCSSAEFAVRPFLLQFPERMQAQMLEWSTHANRWVRRLSSEGIRPRLPWGMGVPALKQDPAPILPILERLKNDPAETVRRSVANNLNDISKDHPELVLKIAQRWHGQSEETDWVVRHACRGLLKKGNAQALALFGFQQEVQGIEVLDFLHDESVLIGARFKFSFKVKNSAKTTAKVRVEYGIEYQTLSGKISYKVFKIKELLLAPGELADIQRDQRFQDFTTRKHYPGPHRVLILINGKEMQAGRFEVLE